MVTTYGMTETAGGCVYDGVPLAGVARAGRPTASSSPGRLLALGYRLDPAATAAAFGDGWFRTRDAGSLDATAGSPCTAGSTTSSSAAG